MKSRWNSQKVIFFKHKFKIKNRFLSLSTVRHFFFFSFFPPTWNRDENSTTHQSKQPPPPTNQIFNSVDQSRPRFQHKLSPDTRKPLLKQPWSDYIRNGHVTRRPRLHLTRTCLVCANLIDSSAFIPSAVVQSSARFNPHLRVTRLSPLSPFLKITYYFYNKAKQIQSAFSI